MVPRGPDTESARTTFVQPNGGTGGRGGNSILTAVKEDEVVQDLCDPTVDQANRRKLPTVVKADEVVQDLCKPTVDQAEEEKTLNGCDRG